MKKDKSFLKESLIRLDIYGKPVQLTYKGKEKFQTLFGGLISLLIMLFVVSIVGIKSSTML